MASRTKDRNSRLMSLDAPALGMSSRDAAEAFLDRLKSQNVALDRLRFELAAEDRAYSDEAGTIGGFR